MTQKTSKKRKKIHDQKDSLYTMEVFIIGGPMTDEFVKRNPAIFRTIAIRGDQTLEELHEAIFDAFDREEEHLYEFQIGGKGPGDPHAKRYGLSDDSMGGSEAEGDVSQTMIHSLKLKEEESFGYWFDFGDDWWHQISVVSIKEEILSGEYPQVIDQVGESPPQYPDFDDE